MNLQSYFFLFFAEKSENENSANSFKKGKQIFISRVYVCGSAYEKLHNNFSIAESLEL